MKDLNEWHEFPNPYDGLFPGGMLGHPLRNTVAGEVARAVKREIHPSVNPEATSTLKNQITGLTRSIERCIEFVAYCQDLFPEEENASAAP